MADENCTDNKCTFHRCTALSCTEMASTYLCLTPRFVQLLLIYGTGKMQIIYIYITLLQVSQLKQGLADRTAKTAVSVAI